MGVKIKDVANAAGVSTATVSRVINNSPLIHPDTAEKVRRAMRELNYFPNSIARSFANQSTYNIALIVDINNSDAFANPFFYQVQFGIEKIICSRGYNLMIINEGSMNNHETAISRIILEKKADGVIFPGFMLKASIVKKMDELNFPFVVIGEAENKFNVNLIDVDNRMGGEIAASHLIENGYKKIAFIAGNPKDMFDKQRIKGYRDALIQHGIEYRDSYVKEYVCDIEDGTRIMKELLSSKDCPDAIVFSSNLAAFGAIKVIKNSGLDVPKDIGIVSFDSYPATEFSDPKITTVDIDVFQLGAQAAVMLLKEFELPSSIKQKTLISVKLISRGSAEKRS
ncbi:MAG: LacI family transcriptional regulator [Clostridia bacterium]|nr:LacI family transcriptional regulator [Clostridia bacterium]